MPIYDISVPIAPGETPTYPGDPGIEFEAWASLERGDPANVTMLHLGAHTGTHLDAPAHFIKGAPGLASLSLDALVGPARVVEIPADAEAVTADEQRVTLRDRGAELLERSSELDDDGDSHPAYARILEQLSPDEARILRLLAIEGPQVAIDVRTWRPLDIGSTIVAPGLSMIAVHAGLMHPDRVPEYLSNLYRLGLIWFSRETLPDPSPYQVLEAQPAVIDAVREAGRARIVRRSIHLTPFGGHFCKLALPLDTVEIEALPAVELE